MNDAPPWELLVRYGAGRVTPAEAERLAAWSAEAPERAVLLQRVGRLVEASRGVAAADDAAHAWQRLERRLAEATPATRVLPVHPPQFAPVTARRMPRRWWRMIAALAAIVVAAVGVGLWGRYASDIPSTAVREITTSRGERLELGLPDGSRVVLGPASRLRLAASGFSEARTLYLEGEGYFTVAHDPAHPFVVRTSGMATQAVGTAFGVRAYEEDSVVQVVVATGRVLLRPESGAPGSGTLLVRSSLGTIDERGQVVVHRDVDVSRYLGWREGELRFERMPLTAVLRELGRAYDIDLAIADTGMAEVPVTATFRLQAAGDVARTLAELLDMRVDSGGTSLWLRPNAMPR